MNSFTRYPELARGAEARAFQTHYERSQLIGFLERGVWRLAFFLSSDQARRKLVIVKNNSTFVKGTLTITQQRVHKRMLQYY